MLTQLAVAFQVMVGHLCSAAIDCIGTWEANGLHKVLQGIAPAVSTGGDTTNIAFARGQKLVATQ